MARVRNPWAFPLFSKPLDRSLNAGEIAETDDEHAEAACRTGVFQWLEGPDGYDGKIGVLDKEGNELPAGRKQSRRGNVVAEEAVEPERETR